MIDPYYSQAQKPSKGPSCLCIAFLIGVVLFALVTAGI